MSNPSRMSPRTKQKMTELNPPIIMALWCMLAVGLMGLFNAVLAGEPNDTTFYVTSSMAPTPSDGVKVGDDLMIKVTGNAFNAPQAHDEKKPGHRWYGFGASFEYKSLKSDVYDDPPPESYTWVTHFPSGSQSKANATGTVKFNVAGYWRITGHDSAAYWTSDSGEESDSSNEKSDDSSTPHEGQDTETPGKVIAVKLDIVPSKPTIPAGDPPWPLDAGILCINAQAEYKQATWKATVKPTDTTAKVTKQSGPITVNGALSVSDGDPVTVNDDGTDTVGQYTLKITSNKVNSASKISDSGTAFKFVAILDGPTKPSATPTPNSGLQGDSNEGVWGKSDHHHYSAFGTFSDFPHDDPWPGGDDDPDFIGEASPYAGLPDITTALTETHSAADAVATIDLGTIPENKYHGKVKPSFDISYYASILAEGHASDWSGSLSVGIGYGLLSLSGSYSVDNRAVGYGVIGLKIGNLDPDFDHNAIELGSFLGENTSDIKNFSASSGSQFPPEPVQFSNTGLGLMSIRYSVGSQAKTKPSDGTLVGCTVRADNVDITDSYWKITP